MAAPFKRGDRWYIRIKDGRGRWKNKATTAINKSEARRLALETDRQYERQRLGLEPLPVENKGTIADLAQWWLNNHSIHTASHSKTESVVRKHVIHTTLGEVPLSEISAPIIENHLHAIADTLGPQSLNHVRRFLVSIFVQAKRHGLYFGENAAKEVKRRKVPKRLPSYLQPHEVKPVLEAINDAWRPLFATAIYSGLRKGELLGLRKTDIDWTNGIILVRRSYDRETTKNSKAEAVPIADELKPYLQRAIKRSTCELVFPNANGEMYHEDTKVERMLRGALGRAGIVERYTHVCRRKGCGYSVESPNAVQQQCPKCEMRLWLKSHVRKIRFHDLRHTTASLLLMAGASPAAVQRVMRHSDPRITTEVYGHLSPGYLQREINLLRFEPAPAEVVEAEFVEQAVAANDAPFAAGLLQSPVEVVSYRNDQTENQESFQPVTAARPERFELPTLGSVDRCSIQLSYGRSRSSAFSTAYGCGYIVKSTRWGWPRRNDISIQ